MKKIADTIENSTNGKPLQNAVITMTISGIAQALYLENDVGSTAVYSVLTDEDGYYEFYIPDGVYDFNAAYGDVSKTVADFEVYDESEQRAILAALPVFASGSYTPTLTDVANVSSSTPDVCIWSRVGDYVTVSGQIAVTPTLTATATSIGISLPVASAFTLKTDAGGNASCPSIEQSGGIEADFTNARASLRFISADTGTRGMFFTFQYWII